MRHSLYVWIWHNVTQQSVHGKTCCVKGLVRTADSGANVSCWLICCCVRLTLTLADPLPTVAGSTPLDCRRAGQRSDSTCSLVSHQQFPHGHLTWEDVARDSISRRICPLWHHQMARNCLMVNACPRLLQLQLCLYVHV